MEPVTFLTSAGRHIVGSRHKDFFQLRCKRAVLWSYFEFYVNIGSGARRHDSGDRELPRLPRRHPPPWSATTLQMASSTRRQPGSRRAGTWVARTPDVAEAQDEMGEADEEVATRDGGDGRSRNSEGGSRDDPWSQQDPWGHWQWQDSWWNGWQSESNSAAGWSRPTGDQNVVRVNETTMAVDGRWRGSNGGGSSHGRASEPGEQRGWEKPTERLTVPSFDGEAGEADLGTSARSYVRKVKVWLRCTKLPVTEQALALYTHLSGKAWLVAEELDVDLLAAHDGVQYYLEWVRVRFMEVEVTKVGNVMTQLFRKCRRRSDQTVRDFNLEFERLILHLMELGCELPSLVKGWLYLDRLKLSENEEMSLLASVNNQYDVKALQQAAIIHDRGTTKRWTDFKGSSKWKGGGQTVHMTHGEGHGSEVEDDEARDIEADQSDAELVAEDVACQYHDAFMAYQDAKSKYRAALKGRGVDNEELKRTSEERLKAAKARSYCAACKRKGHWHKDPECPLRGKSRPAEAQVAHQCNSVHMCYMVGIHYEAVAGSGKDLVAITDTACSKTVAGHGWFEQYCKVADDHGWEVEIVEEADSFKFGASRVHESRFAVWCNFAVRGVPFKVKVAVVLCDVPLLFSRQALGKLGMIFNVADNTVDLKGLGLYQLSLTASKTGHPALVVTDYQDACFQIPWALDPEVQLARPAGGVYMVRGVEPEWKRVFYPKKLAAHVEGLLSGEDMPVASFFMWWAGANQSRDFWVETRAELIRVHVVPRKGPFDLRSWQTSLTTLRGQLLGAVGEECTVEAIPCHGDGVVSFSRTFMWNDERAWSDAVDESGMWGLWVGRSRFTRSRKTEPYLAVDVPAEQLTMADEQGAAAAEARRGRSGGQPSVDGAGAAPDLGGVQRGAQAGGNVRGAEGPQPEEPQGAQGDGDQGGHRAQREGDAGLSLKKLRESAQSTGDQVVVFGRYRGWFYHEVPKEYLNWVMTEMKANPNASDDLVRLATWAQKDAARSQDVKRELRAPAAGRDPEAMAVVPPPQVVEWPSSSETEAVRSQKGKGKAMSKAEKRAQAMGAARETMEIEVPEVVKTEIEALQTRLALLQQAHGLAPGAEVQKAEGERRG